MDVGNPTTNVIPGEARAGFNIRFNDLHTADDLTAWVTREAAAVAKVPIARLGEDSCVVSGVSFPHPAEATTLLVSKAVESVTGAAPQFSTSGGTSDARVSIKDFCPVVELYWRAPQCTRPMNACSVMGDCGADRYLCRLALRIYFDTDPDEI